MHLTKEEQVLQKHFSDLIRSAYQKGIPMYSEFTSLMEKELAYQAVMEFYNISSGQVSNMMLEYGGYQEAERKILCFLPEPIHNAKELSDSFPLTCVQFVPANVRFSDALTHRDYLGTLMGLGITRNQIGDIVIKERTASGKSYEETYVFCMQKQTEQVLQINRIKHTTVHAEIADPECLQWEQEFIPITGSVASLRLDAIVSVAIKLPRAKCIPLIQGNLVFLNGRLCTENAKTLKDGDVFSIRGYGKFTLINPGFLSKKGRYQIIVNKYK